MQAANSSALVGAVGTELGVSDWLEITQERIDAFAVATEDRQWIHVDPMRAKTGPYGATIAHGYLLLSLLPFLRSQVLTVAGDEVAVNYGLDRVRFISPVPVGSRIRARVRLTELSRSGGTSRAMFGHSVEIAGAARLAYVADAIVLFHAPDRTS